MVTRDQLAVGPKLITVLYLSQSNNNLLFKLLMFYINEAYVDVWEK